MHPWTTPTGPLGDLTAESRARARALRADAAALARLEQGLAGALVAEPDAVAREARFAAALRRPNVALVAEVKRRSPSKGSINEGIVAAEQARAYEAGGAAAISVLTEPTRFGGSVDDLRAVTAAVAVPVLRKDFITDEVQLREARAAGAAAVLLIARALPPDELARLATAAAVLGLGRLVEVRDAGELSRALAIAGAVIGVNNRDLETLAIDDGVSQRLIPVVPPDRVVLYESGVRGVADVERAAACGADGVLVGSVLSAAADAVAAARSLSVVPRRARG